VQAGDNKRGAVSPHAAGKFTIGSRVSLRLFFSFIRWRMKVPPADEAICCYILRVEFGRTPDSIHS
jgi:hypothetical protein